MPAILRSDKLAELVEQIALAAADVEHAHAGLDAVAIDQGLGERAPASVITIAAIAVAPVAVPVVLPPLPRDGGGFCLVVLDHALNVVPPGRCVHRLEQVDLAHGAQPVRGIVTGWWRIY
ncbi:hypothetical protein BwSH14_55410 [Bradyrhizobium ottawaense]|nr:hypothetical protein BwSH14_55410 [Bradyrhizobium ottawaense]GMO65890.1 hypothetical protein BwSH17_17660 [Bradyrhizobium ottawaense]